MPTVAELIVDTLARAGVSRIFGAADSGAGVKIVEAARKAGLSFVRCHQETAACLMAAVTGELTGFPGVALAASGPGVTASVTGVAHAWLDRAPLLLVTDRHPESTLPLTARQHVDHAVLLAPIVKGSVIVTADSVSHWVAHAIQLALAEPRGPVHLDLPVDVASQPALPMATSVARPASSAPDAVALDRAAALIAGAKRPVVVAGLQCRKADARWLHAFCEAAPAPLFTTVKAKGAIPDPHPLAMGVLTGTLDEPALARADLIVAFGVDPVEFFPAIWRHAVPVLSLARCPSGDVAGGCVGFAPALELVGELDAMLEELAPRLVGRYRADWDVGEVERLRRDRVRGLRSAAPGLTPHRVVELAREFTPVGTIATVDPGAHVPAAMACWQAVEPGEFLISNGIAMPGFALPAAVAAQLVHPERRVLCFTDARGLLVAAAELETAARLEARIAIIVFEHDAGRGSAAVARALGLPVFTADGEPAFRTALASALATPTPSMIAARVLPGERPVDGL